MDFTTKTVKELRDLKLEINAIIKDKLVIEKSATESNKEASKEANRKAGAEFLAKKPIGSKITVKVGDDLVEMIITKINLEKSTVSGHRLDENGDKVLNADGKPVTLWRYFEAIEIS